MSAPPDPDEQLQPLLAWLGAEPDADSERELLAALDHIDGLGSLGLTPERTLALLDSFHGRAFDLTGRFRARLIGGSLPLAREFFLPVRRLVQLCVELAGHYLRVARDLASDMTRTQRLGENSLGARGLDLLTEAWVLGAMGGMSPQYDLWGTAHGLFIALGGPAPEGGLFSVGRDDRTMRAYKRLLVLSVIQPESFSARELGWVADFLEEQGGMVQLEPLEPGCTSGYWIDPAQDMALVAIARRGPPDVDGLLHVTTEPLARLVTQRLEYLEGGDDDERLADAVESVVAVTVQADLPEGLAPRELLTLLRRLREHWAMPPLREMPRRRNHYAVEACLGLRAVWEMRQHGEASVEISEWVVVNESPGGFSIMSVTGVTGALSAGMALAIRRDGTPKWSLCVVRWIRSENPSQVELGLQVVSEGATPVRLGFRSGQVREMVYGLLLPPLGEVRRHQAMMAPAGTHSSRRFVFVHEGARIYVAQGRLLSLDIQTASVEVFQFEVDPYPT